jgi:hypothetical protein
MAGLSLAAEKKSHEKITPRKNRPWPRLGHVHMLPPFSPAAYGAALPRLFISHSSKDNVEALAFRRWLAANGWAESEVLDAKREGGQHVGELYVHHAQRQCHTDSSLQISSVSMQNLMPRQAPPRDIHLLYCR